MKKILYVASVTSHIGSFHRAYIDALRAEGHEVCVMANGEGADINVPFHKKFFSWQNKTARKMIKRAVNEGGFDTVILNTSLAAFHTRLALGKSRPRVINIVHGYLFPLKASGGLFSRIKRLMLLFAERLVAKKTDSIIVMNEEDLEIAKKYKLTRGKISLCQGMGVPRKIPSDERDALRYRLGMQGRFVILFAGELSKRKNQHYLISLMPRLLEKEKNAELWLLGDGDERDNLISLSRELAIEDKVKLLGRKSNVQDYMSACDVYASASRSEGLPFNTIEAMSVGAYTVCSSVKGHTDAMKCGGGELFDLADTGLAEKLILCGRDKVLPIEQARTAAQRFLFDEAFEKTYSLIKGCMQ